LGVNPTLCRKGQSPNADKIFLVSPSRDQSYLIPKLREGFNFYFAIMQKDNLFKTLAPTAVLVVIFAIVAVSVSTEFNPSKSTNSIPTLSPTAIVNTDNLTSVTVRIVDINGAEKVYPLAVKQGQTVYEVLNQLKASASGFSFTSKQYSFGAMIMQFNNSNYDTTKYFWELRINDKASTVGVSDYNVQKNDSIKFILTKIN